MTNYEISTRYVDVKGEGAIGNGVADDTNQLLASIAKAGIGGKLLFPPGEYKYSTTLVPLTQQIWEGNSPRTTGSGATALTYTGSGSAIQMSTGYATMRGFMINCTNNVSTVVGLELVDPATLNRFTDLNIQGPSTSNGIAIYLHGQISCVCHNTFEGVRASNWKEGAVLSGFANANLFSQGWFGTLGTGYAISLSPRGTDTMGGSDNLFERIEIDGGVANGIYLVSGANRNVFVKVVEDGVSTIGLLIDSAGACLNNVFLGCSFAGSVTNLQRNHGNMFIGCPGTTIPNGDQFVIGNANLHWGTDSITSVDYMQTDGVFYSKRLIMLGTALVTGDFALSAGWGNTATVTVAAGSTDARFRISVLAQGTGIAADPTITLTFHDGQWSNGSAPFCSAERGDNLATAGDLRNVTRSATAPVFKFKGTPVSGETYIFDVICVG